MTIVNQFNRYIIEEEIIEKIEHMLTFGYGSIQIDGQRVTYEDEYELEGERFVLVNVGEEVCDVD